MAKDAVPVMLIAVCIAILVPTGLGQEVPTLPFGQIPGEIPGLLVPISDVIECWSSLTNIPTCLTEIYGSFLGGQIGQIGPACCDAINRISGSCWPKMFPLSPSFPSLLKNYCALPPSLASEAKAVSKVSIPTVNVTEIKECWSSITSSEGCALEIFKSRTIGQITGIGPACRETVTRINGECWPKMFPFNPFFPPLFKNRRPKVTELATTPQAV
ncbi:uncharacterized protein LOC102621105 [Citrus sinensis]|uniref:Prolamin-like domain-containing protein n=2 Tax=Citrus TaxID=2706 RepID=A0A067GDK1_CITSI|nr:uncharacterized protein LOC102621105 [Citrus sinensis]KDO73582.1 hypothetical protein CISIN_1g037452mg [Citrus sinensis]BAK61843.1 hypothetical protein [Citrus unshiu]